MESKTNLQYKDRLFRFIFGAEERKENLLSLYNALNGSDYSDIDGLEIATIEDFIYMGFKNDVSFIVEDALNLYEHQSTYNPNMPLRGLFYYASMYERYVDTHELNIYSSKRLRIPTPQYVVFYNGNKEAPDQEILKLSDLFTAPSRDGGCYEWTATMLNINLPHNAAIMDKCRPLWEYAYFVDQVKQFNQDHPIEEAIDLAVKKCIETNVMANILEAHRAEVTEMLMNEYNEDKTMDLFKKEFIQEGIQQGIKTERELANRELQTERELANRKLQAERNLAKKQTLKTARSLIGFLSPDIIVSKFDISMEDLMKNPPDDEGPQA